MDNNHFIITSKITYTIKIDQSLGFVSPYIFAQRLKESIEVEITHSRVFMNCLEEKGQILLECNLPSDFPIADNSNVRKKIQELAQDLTQKLTEQNNLIKTCYQKSYNCFNTH